MPGFFFHDLKKAPRTLPSVVAEGCKYCPLALEEKHLKHPRMPSSGSSQPILYIVGEGPGASEDDQGTQFVGASGNLLRSVLSYDIQDEIRYDNSVRCRPPNNRTPTEVEIGCCKVHLFEDILKYRPKLILGLGGTALKSIVGESDVSAWRGRLIVVDIKGFRTYFICTYHPAYVLRISNRDFRCPEEIIFKLDIQSACEFAKGEVAPPEPLGGHIAGIDTTTNPIVVSRFLSTITTPKALDLETTALRPFNRDSKILSVAIGDFDKTLAFPLHHPEGKNETILREFRNFLLEKVDIPLWCHNLAFELEWLAWIYGLEVLRNRRWEDTMMQSRALDNRTNMYSLDTMTKIYFGFSEKAVLNVDPTRWKEYPLTKLLLYNGLDAKWTYRLSQVQGEELSFLPSLATEYERLRRTVPTLVAAQIFGLYPDFDKAKQLEIEYKEEEKHYADEIERQPDVIKYRKMFGPFNPSSPPQVARLLKSVLNISTTSADEKVLSSIDPKVSKTPELILHYRQAVKIRSTYIEPITLKKITYDDHRIHTVIHQHTTVTGRLSSDSPNIQNYPKRERGNIRVVIGVPEGHDFLRFDFGQIEARVLGMESEDKNFCDKLWKNYDIHGDWAQRLKHRRPSILHDLELKDDKALRDSVKNSFVFALFYGAGPENTANRLKIPVSLATDLVNEFWSEFGGIKAWHKKVIAKYEKLGYVETLTGRRIGGVLSLNQLANSPTQGTASDIVVDGMNRLSEFAFETKQPHYQPVINVHDELCFYIPKSSITQSVRTIAEMLCVSPFKFINIPLSVSASSGENWYEQSDLGTFQTTDFRTAPSKIPPPHLGRSPGPDLRRSVYR